MKKTLRKIASFVVRWGIAVVGIWWVVTNMSLADHALVLDARNRPVEIEVREEITPERYRIVDPAGHVRDVDARELVNAPDRKTVELKGTGRTVHVLAMDLAGQKSEIVNRLLVADTPDGDGRWIAPADVAGDFHLRVPHPRIEVGLRRMAKEANGWYLMISVAIFPVTIILTSIRWRRLLNALEIRLTLGQTLALNWVGLFYNTFIPMGSTGGDLLKAYYAAKYTDHKTRAVMSVIVDRIIGLLVLVILGGSIAGGYYLFASDKMDPAVRACRGVAMMAGLIIVGSGGFLVAAFNVRLRAVTGFDRLLARLPMQKHVQSAIEVMAIYRQRPGLVLWAMIVTVPVHVTVIVSAILAGKAFGLPVTWGYYFIVVPVTVLVGAIPVSPQGAGVMEFFAINLTARQGATISQAFALTMSIRMVQIVWNLVGGIYLISGHYRAPKKEELAENTLAS